MNSLALNKLYDNHYLQEFFSINPHKEWKGKKKEKKKKKLLKNASLNFLAPMIPSVVLFTLYLQWVLFFETRWKLYS